MTAEDTVRLEAKIDRLLAYLERFEPLLDRLLSGGSMASRVMIGTLSRKNAVPSFSKGRSNAHTDQGEGRDPAA